MRLMLALAALIIGAAAHAADYRPGPYAGISIGYAAGNLGNDGGDIATDGINVGGILGYTHIIGGTNFLIGIEGEAVLSSVKGTQGPSSFQVEASNDYSVFIKPRLGMVFGPAAIYAFAGPAWTHSKIEIVGLKDSNFDLGMVAGAGADIQITNTIALRLEAMRSMTFGQDWSIGGATAKLDAAETTGKLGLVINLN